MAKSTTTTKTATTKTTKTAAPKAKAQPKKSATAAKIEALPNGNKINWGAVKASTNFRHILVYNILRKGTIKLKERHSTEMEMFLRKYPGHFEKSGLKSKLVYKLDNSAQQVEFNTLYETLQKKQREEKKKDAQAYKGIFKELFPKDFYNVYVIFASGQTDKKMFREKCFEYLQGGLQVPFGKKGLDEFTDRLCDAIGVKLTSDKAFAKTDNDTEPHGETAFGKLVLGVTRQFLIDKNVIIRDALDPAEDDMQPTEKPEKKESETPSTAQKFKEQVLKEQETKTKKTKAAPETQIEIEIPFAVA